jgi:8-amino-7-oxononanoate synthase
VLVDARSNDYLGLAGRGVSRETAESLVGLEAGAGASRLIAGTSEEHLAFEAEVADWLGTEACLLFSSGYAANLGVVSALARPGDTVLSDALNHASIIDGCRLSRAEVVVLPHRDLTALRLGLEDRAGRNAASWVVTESYFGMDADVPDLAAIRGLCDRFGAALVVDEAHALGIFGRGGRGLCEEAGVTPDVLVGGLGKGFGAQGGFAACSSVIRSWLWNRARSFVFSTAPGPVATRLAREQLDRLRGEDAGRARLRQHEERLAVELNAGGVPVSAARRGPIFPIVIGAELAALEAAQALAARGVLCHAIRPPTVPAGGSRIRVTLRADMSEQQVATLGTALTDVWRNIGARFGRATLSSDAPDAAFQGARESTVGETRRANAEGGPGASSSSASRSLHVGGRSRGAEAAEGPLSQGAGQADAGARTHHGSPQWLVFGTGTGVGKTFVAEGLVRRLAQRRLPVLGLKPIETGCLAPGQGGARDARRLGAVSFHVKQPTPHPLYAFPDPVAPSLAARNQGAEIVLEAVARWVTSAVQDQDQATSIVIETAGGVFSPLNAAATNFDLGRALDWGEWILVAPDRLGVLHDVLSTLRAMGASGRQPDWLVLSSPECPDQSTGTNAAELRAVGVRIPIVSLRRDETEPLDPILTSTFATLSAPSPRPR